MSSVESFFGSGAAAAKFDQIGDKFAGVIVDEPQVVQQRNYDTDEPEFWSDGQPKMQVVLTVREDGTEEERRLFVKAGLQKAFKDALRRAGQRAPQLGAHVTVTYSGDGEQKNRKFKPPKLYTVVYVPPADDDEIGAAVKAFEKDASDGPPF